MSSTGSFQARLAGIDPLSLRDPGAAGEALRRSLLVGARIAVIEPGYVTKRFLYERARLYGVELVLVGDPSGWAQTLVDEGIAVEFVDADPGGEPEAGARAVLAALGEAARLDGVITFWEDAVPAMARVAEALGLPGFPPAAADAARSKLRTLDASRAAGLPTPRFVHLEGPESLRAAAEYVGFPAVIKPVFGSEALGCLRADDFAMLEAGYARVSALITPELNAIFEQGCDLMLEEYLDGTEFDVDLVLSGGECVFAGVSENWVTEEPYFVETGMHSPSAHPPERLEAITDLCVRTALALGFRDGVLHAEAKDTSRGPRLLEINARLGGGVIADIHRLVTGVDLVEQQLLLAVGLPAVPRAHPRPAAGVTTVFMHASHSGRFTHTRWLDHLAPDPSVIQHDVLVKPGQPVTAAVDGFPTVIAELTVFADDAPGARARALELVDALELPYAG
ncbi:MAG TPA: ATP-grasp domain-containing protein [Gaiellaceae bacterium]|nr:ATP-grasp domain-containing protein [Gaiellaceae bacterium]